MMAWWWVAALTVAGSPALGVACGASAGFNVTRAGSGSGVAAVVVRGDAFRDCGHGVRCAAACTDEVPKA